MTAMSFKQFLVNEGRRNKYDYSSLLVEPPEEIADNVISWGWDHVPNESVFLDPKDPSFGREDDPHITLIYGIHTDILKEVSDLFVKEKEFECKLGKVDMFTKSDKFDVLIVSVECEELHRLNSKMRRNLEATESYPVYVPHITICYLKKGHAKQYIGSDAFVDEKFNINKIFFSSKTGEKTPIKLGSK
jgi:2'-5' RNA ligase